MNGTTDTGLNLEYWFRIIYECLTGKCIFGISGFDLTSIWLWIVWLGYVIIVLGLLFIVYALVKIFDLRHREEHQLGTLIVSEETSGPNKRWEHIQSLMESSEVASWRQAIIEADIVLDEMLTRQGYEGSGVGDKLKMVEPSDFNTLSDAWEAHKVRNQIAHEGSSFNLSDTLARRTIARYETVFREFGFI